MCTEKEPTSDASGSTSSDANSGTPVPVVTNATCSCNHQPLAAIKGIIVAVAVCIVFWTFVIVAGYYWLFKGD